MDNGFVTGSNGKTADCRNIVLILTTNLGSQEAETNAIGFGDVVKEYEDTELKKFFAPEFRNRLDAMVEFVSLEREHIDMIVNKTINEINEMLSDKNVTIQLSDEARIWLRDKGYQPEMGARPLQRVVNDYIKKPLSKEILFGKLLNGGSVTIKIVDDEIGFEY